MTNELIIVRLIKLPHGVRGFTIPDADGNDNVYINKDLSGTAQQEAYLHELRHIQQGDCWSDAAAGKIEQEMRF